ncbi:MAG: acireductone dioxygenase [Oscillatoriaceae cyanobacterium Prado104]|jgi:1,2-dihydroxy-3-keto-5-methylthiopentene dioxygenase|nr:acireductone dioxygenase [Oscillatoriaceae cyanobacterium Prado104]
MSVLQLENGRIYSEIGAIARQLDALNITVDRQPIKKNPAVEQLLVQDILNPAEKQQVLLSLKGEFENLKRASGYQWYDLKVLHPGSPQVYAIANQSHRTHTHKDAEVLHVLTGECVFGFVNSKGSQLQLLLQAEECIKVPPNTEHWFYLVPPLCLKAVQYYTTAEGWIPQYTNRKLEIRS